MENQIRSLIQRVYDIDHSQAPQPFAAGQLAQILADLGRVYIYGPNDLGPILCSSQFDTLHADWSQTKLRYFQLFLHASNAEALTVF